MPYESTVPTSHPAAGGVLGVVATGVLLALGLLLLL
jgi:hypothetical protein